MPGYLIIFCIKRLQPSVSAITSAFFAVLNSIPLICQILKLFNDFLLLVMKNEIPERNLKLRNHQLKYCRLQPYFDAFVWLFKFGYFIKTKTEPVFIREKVRFYTVCQNSAEKTLSNSTHSCLQKQYLWDSLSFWMYPKLSISLISFKLSL